MQGKDTSKQKKNTNERFSNRQKHKQTIPWSLLVLEKVTRTNQKELMMSNNAMHEAKVPSRSSLNAHANKTQNTGAQNPNLIHNSHSNTCSNNGNECSGKKRKTVQC